MRKFTEDLEREGFIGGSDREFPDINNLHYYYESNKKVTVPEAREILVLHVEELLNRINSDLDIRPYLCEYPFRSKYITLGFDFFDENGNECRTPYVASVRLLSNYENGGITNNVTYTFRNSETGIREGKFHNEKYSEAKAIYYELYSNQSKEESLEKNP